jgi:molybdopterin/thiamine biosynthesis adenylyltransferase
MNEDLDFTDAELERYSRHILLPEVGAIGQSKIRSASVLIIGAGGLGAPMIVYLAAAGIGRIGIVDDDAVDLSNLQRQIIHTTDRIGVNKAESAAKAARDINPEIKIDIHRLRLEADNIDDVMADYDIVADGTDNFDTRYRVNDAAVRLGKTLVTAALLRFDGQITTVKPGGPCYRCLFPNPPPPGAVPSCSEAGVLGSVAGILGTMQATEIVKEIVGIGESLSGRLLLFDGLSMTMRDMKAKQRPDCAACGQP